VKTTVPPNQSAAANRRPAGQLDGSGNLSAIVAADRAFPAAVAELVRRNVWWFLVFGCMYEEIHFHFCRLVGGCGIGTVVLPDADDKPGRPDHARSFRH
jgi:hypothetical protein